MIVANVIVYQTSDGGMAVIHPAPAARGRVLVSPVVMEERTDLVPVVEAGGDGEPVVGVAERKYQVEVAPAQYRPETDEEFLPRVAAGAVPKGVEFHIVDDAILPPDRVLRPAWKFNGNAVVEDVARAKAQLAAERERVLSTLNDQLAEAATKGGDIAELTSKLERASAVLPEIDKASTPERLKEILVSLRSEADTRRPV